MRNIEHRPQDVTDSVAGPHRHAAGQGRHRHPCTHLAIQAGLDIGWIGFYPGQTAGQQRQPLQRLGIAIGMRLAGTDALDAVIDGADTGGQEQPFRRVHRRRRIKDHRFWHDPGMTKQLLDVGPLVGHAGNGAELTTRQGRRHGDLRHRRRVARRWSGHSIRADHGAQHIHLLRLSNVVGQTQRHRLGGIGDRTAAEGND